MAKFSFEEKELSSTKLDDLGAFERSTLQDWYDKFKIYRSYPIVGRTSIPPTDLRLTRSALRQYDGKQPVPEGRVNAPIYIGIGGKIFDVSYGGVEMYGAEGPYNLFAGLDASKGLPRLLCRLFSILTPSTSCLHPPRSAREDVVRPNVPGVVRPLGPDGGRADGAGRLGGAPRNQVPSGRHHRGRDQVNSYRSIDVLHSYLDSCISFNP